MAYDHGDKCDCDHDCFFDNVLMDDSEDIPKLATSDDLETMKIYLHGRREEEIEKVEDAEGVFDCSILDYEEAEPRRIGSILDNEREAIYLPELQADSDSDSSDTVSADGGETGLCPTVGQNVCASWGALLSRFRTVSPRFPGRFHPFPYRFTPFPYRFTPFPISFHPVSASFHPVSPRFPDVS